MQSYIVKCSGGKLGAVKDAIEPDILTQISPKDAIASLY